MSSYGARTWPRDAGSGAGRDGEERIFENLGLFGGFRGSAGHIRDTLPNWLRHDGVSSDRWAPSSTNVTTSRLVSVLRRHGAPEVIDYLSLDVEGAEYEVLADPELHAAYKFRAISVEHNANNHGSSAVRDPQTRQGRMPWSAPEHLGAILANVSSTVGVPAQATRRATGCERCSAVLGIQSTARGPPRPAKPSTTSTSRRLLRKKREGPSRCSGRARRRARRPRSRRSTR